MNQLQLANVISMDVLYTVNWTHEHFKVFVLPESKYFETMLDNR